MKKFLIILLVLSLCVGAVAALVGYRNRAAQEALLQSSIAAFETGDLDTASSGFKTLMEETDDPDMETVYRFTTSYFMRTSRFRSLAVLRGPSSKVTSPKGNSFG